MLTLTRRFILAVALLLSARPALAADKWIRVRTDHFDTVGNVTDIELRRIAQTLEHFHDVVVSAAMRGPGTSSTRATVLIFKDDFSFTPYKPQGAGRSSIGGLFFLNGDDTLLALNADNLGFAFRTVLDGYSQAVLQRSTGAVPLWLGIGLGQVYETFEERKGGKGALIGRPDADTVNTLKNTSLLPLPVLFATDRSAPGMTLGSANRQRFEAESWALVHYLSFGPRHEQFRQFLAGLRLGVGQEQALRASIGDLDVLEHELNDYIHKFTFPAVEITFDEKMTPAMPTKGELLKDAEADAYLCTLLARSGYPDQARSRLAKALTTTPDSAAATAAMARLDLLDNKMDEALTLLERAATLAPADGGLQAELGHYLAYDVSRGGRESTSAALVHARTVLNRAVELDRDNAGASADLGWMLLFDPAEPARAVTLLTGAIERSPTREVYKLWLADALRREHQFDRAKDLLGPLMGRGSTPEIRSEARRLLGLIATDANKGAGPTPGGASAPER